jgi:uncharacterized protein YqfB (UPF0267 family)
MKYPKNNKIITFFDFQNRMISQERGGCKIQDNYNPALQFWVIVISKKGNLCEIDITSGGCISISQFFPPLQLLC